MNDVLHRAFGMAGAALTIQLGLLMGCADDASPESEGSTTSTGSGGGGGEGGAWNEGPPLEVEKSAAATRAMVTGQVVDPSGAPVPVVTVMVGDTQALVDEGGWFEVEATTGPVSVAAFAPGHVGWNNLLPLTGDGLDVRVVLAPFDDAVTIGQAGAVLQTGPVSLEYPPGAYDADVPVRARWIGPTDFESLSGGAYWQDPAGVPVETLGTLHLEASTEPAMSVLVSIPIPDGVEQVALHHVDAGGAAAERLDPLSIGEGLAVFEVPHFDAWRAVNEQPRPGAKVLSGHGTMFAGNGPEPIGPGSDIPSNAIVETQETMTVSMDDGAIIRMRRSSGRILSTPSERSIQCTSDNCDVLVHERRPQGKVVPYLSIRTKTAVAAGPKGTVFRVEDEVCPQGAANAGHYYAFEVPEGAVVVRSAGESVVVEQGERAEACDGCTDLTVSRPVPPTARHTFSGTIPAPEYDLTRALNLGFDLDGRCGTCINEFAPNQQRSDGPEGVDNSFADFVGLVGSLFFPVAQPLTVTMTAPGEALISMPVDGQDLIFPVSELRYSVEDVRQTLTAVAPVEPLVAALGAILATRCGVDDELCPGGTLYEAVLQNVRLLADIGAASTGGLVSPCTGISIAVGIP